MATIDEAKTSLDKLMTDAQLYWYKPIHTAEILRKSRLRGSWFESQADYWNESTGWRNAATQELLGTSSTSSNDYQKSLFQKMTFEKLEVLHNANVQGQGVVERYIYESFAELYDRLEEVLTNPQIMRAPGFRVKTFMDALRGRGRLKGPLIRLCDKALEVVAHSLLQTCLDTSSITTELTAGPGETSALQKVDWFSRFVLGDAWMSWNAEVGSSVVSPAQIFRAGRTNAADGGLDMWTTFGVAIQAKHTSTTRLAKIEKMVSQIDGADVVLIFRKIKEDLRTDALADPDFGHRIRWILSEEDLDDLVSYLFESDMIDVGGRPFLAHFQTSLAAEFPNPKDIRMFASKRGYAKPIRPTCWLASREALR